MTTNQSRSYSIVPEFAVVLVVGLVALGGIVAPAAADTGAKFDQDDDDDDDVEIEL